MGRPKGSKNKNHKEKPVKEKKEKKHKGIKQKQHQEQHQIVNVNINTRKNKSSDDEDKKERKRKVKNNFQNMIPNIIFNPSLTIPSAAPINRPDTNPPYFDMSSLIQSLQPAQPQPAPPLRAPPTSIMDQIQQVTTNISTTKDKIKDEIKPITPVIPEPIRPGAIGSTSADYPQFVPNPITPDIIIDSNISTSIHNKHMNNKSNIKDIIPQQPTEKTMRKPKYKDTEGLGKTIPISNIGAIAGTIASGGAYGGAIAAGEALFTGGLTGLAAAGENILGSAVGGGVGAGVNNALGGGDIGHVVSGIVGGIAGRTAGTRTRTRAPRAAESEPLLGSRGNRLGGRSNRNRLVDDSEIQLAPEPQVVQPPGVMSNIRDAASRAMQATTDTVNNIRHQITGRVINASRGRYSRVPTTEIHDEPIAQQVRQQSEPPVIDLTNEIMPDLNRSATVIQRLNRAVRQRRANTDRVYREQISREFDENMMRTRNEELQRNQEAINELDQILRQDALNQVAANQSASATTIQNALRGKRARNTARTLTRERTINMMQNDIMANGVVNDVVDNAVNQSAATTIQSAVRNRNALNETIGRAQKKVAATKIQSAVRNRNAINETIKRAKIKETLNNATENTRKQDAAATKIQSAVRNKKAINKFATEYVKKVRNTPISISTQPPRPSTQPMIDLISDNVSRNVVKNAINKIAKKQSASTTIQTAMRGHLARNELGNRINAAEQQQAKNTLSSAVKSKRARQELSTQKTTFNPIDYQDKIRANKKTFQNQVLDYTTRRPQPITQEQAKKLSKATKRINSITTLAEKRKQPGRPARDQSFFPSSRLSTASNRLSTPSTLPPDSPGAAFTPQKK